MRVITERLANLSIPQVLIIVAILVVIRFVLPRLWKQPAAKTVAEIAESLAVAMALVFLLIRPFLIQTFYIPSLSMYPTLLEYDQIIVNKMVYRLGEPKRGDVVVFKAPPAATPDTTLQAESEAGKKNLTGKERDEYIKKREKALEKDFIKRVVGVPGDIIYVTRAYALIDGIPYDRVGLRTLVASGNVTSVKFLEDGIVVDGTKASLHDIAVAYGDPKAKVKIFPGRLYVNGKPLNEPYIAEDSDLPYPYLDGPDDRRTPDSDLKYVVEYKGRKAIKIPPGKLLVMGDNRNNSNDARFWGLLDRDRVLGKAMVIFWPVNRIGAVR